MLLWRWTVWTVLEVDFMAIYSVEIYLFPKSHLPQFPPPNFLELPGPELATQAFSKHERGDLPGEEEKYVKNQQFRF